MPGPLYFRARAASGELVKVANLNTQGYTMINFEWLVKFAPFDRVEERIESARKLNAIAGVRIPERSAVEATWPVIDPKALASGPAQSQFLEFLDWVAARLGAAL